MSTPQSSLKKQVGLASVVSLGLGTAVGVSIFSVAAPATAVAGPAMLASVAIAAVPMFVIAVGYAFLGSAAPTSGASYEWPRRYIHPAVGFMVAWLRLIGSLGALIILAFVLVNYLSLLVPLPTKPAMLGVFLIIFALNILGVGVAARAQTILIAVLVLVLIGFAVIGAASIDASAFTPFLPNGWGGAIAALPLLIGLFFGIEAATEVGEEVSGGRWVIPAGIALSIVIAAALYLLVNTVVLGVLGPEQLAASDAPLLDAAGVFLGDWGAYAMVAAAVAAIGTSLNALFLIFSRTLLAMGRSGVLPRALATIERDSGTPRVALVVVLGLCILGLLAPMNLTALFLAVSIPTLLKYASTCTSAAIVALRHPEVYDKASFRFGRQITAVWCGLGAIGAVVVAAVGWTADWTPYAALGAWGLIGVAYYVIRSFVGGGAPQEPRSNPADS
ncbi:MAG: APC family permease [Maricaulaceae bacterium]|jgi:APA family basic amino acid/polyamine antiporter